MVFVKEKIFFVVIVDDKYELVLVLVFGVFGGGECVVCVVLFNGRDSDYWGVYIFVGWGLGLSELEYGDWFVGLNVWVYGRIEFFLNVVFCMMDGEVLVDDGFVDFICYGDFCIVFISYKMEDVVYCFLRDGYCGEIFVLWLYRY